MLYLKLLGNDDVYGAPRDLATINPQEVRAIYTNHINKLAKIRETTIPVNFSFKGKDYSIPTGRKYSVVPPASQTKLLRDFNKHPALCNIQASDHWWSTVTKWLWSFVGPRKVSESFSSAIQDNRYAKELRTLSFMHANKNYQSILNRLNDLSQLDKAYPRLRAIAQAARDEQRALKQQQINAIAANPDLAYQQTTTQPLLTTSTEQAVPSNSIAQQEVSGETSAQQQAPTNDVVTQPTVFAKTSTQKISFSAEAMQAALAQARSELEAQKSDITVRFSPRLGQLVFNLKSQQSQASTPAALMQQQAESSAPTALAQNVDILSPAAQELLSSCGLTSPAVHAVAPEHQLFIQQSEAVLNNAAQAYKDGIVSDVVIAETIILTRTAQELELAGHSDKASALLAIIEKKCNGLTAPNTQDSNWYYMSDPCDDAAAELAAFESFGRTFGHAGNRVVHNIKHPTEFLHRQIDGIKNLTLITAKSLNTFAKFLSEDPDLGREACGDVASAAQAIWEAAKTIGSMSEHEREEFFGHLIGDSIVDTVGLKGVGKAASVVKPVIKSTSTAIIERTAQSFKKPRIPLYDNAIKKLETSQTHLPRIRTTASKTGPSIHKMPPPPKFANPHRIRKRTVPATSSNNMPATAATSSAGSGQAVGKAKEAVKWTPYDHRHIASKKMAWRDIIKSTKSGPAKYKPEINVELLETMVWQKGTMIPGKNWKIYACEKIIGASDGIESSFMIVKNSMNIIHGHPITPQKFQQYMNMIGKL